MQQIGIMPSGQQTRKAHKWVRNCANDKRIHYRK